MWYTCFASTSPQVPSHVTHPKEPDWKTLIRDLSLRLQKVFKQQERKQNKTKTQEYYSTTSTFRPLLALRRTTIQPTSKENVYEHITWLNSGRNQGLGLTHPLHGFLYFFTRGVWLQTWWNKTSSYMIQSKTNNEKRNSLKFTFYVAGWEKLTVFHSSQNAHEILTTKV